jgi:shikimate dehydrogenase
MKRFALTGSPISHSKSPALFHAAYHGKYSYELMPASTAEGAIRLFKEKGLSGMNVTMPLKAEILPHADELDATVSALGVGNTMVSDNGRLKLYNTDVDGVLGVLKEAGKVLRESKCLILGAGGAGKAAAYASQLAGIEFAIANRTLEKAEKLARQFNTEALPLHNALNDNENYDIIINTLPASTGLGRLLNLHAHQAIIDANYTNQALHERCFKMNITYLDGTRWLLHQAIPAYCLFTNEEPDTDAMEAALRGR